MTPLFLTKYEATELISGRVMLLSRGAATFLTPKEVGPHRENLMWIACKELLLRRIDAKVVRDDREYDLSSMELPECVHNLVSVLTCS